MENAAVQRLARVLKNEKKLAEFGGTGSNFVGESGDLEEHSGADSDIFGIESNSVSGYEEDESILTSVRPPTCKRDQDGRGDRKGSAELDFEEAALGQIRQGQHSSEPLGWTETTSLTACDQKVWGCPYNDAATWH